MIGQRGMRKHVLKVAQSGSKASRKPRTDSRSRSAMCRADRRAADSDCGRIPRGSGRSTSDSARPGRPYRVVRRTDNLSTVPRAECVHERHHRPVRRQRLLEFEVEQHVTLRPDKLPVGRARRGLAILIAADAVVAAGKNRLFTGRVASVVPSVVITPWVTPTWIQWPSPQACDRPRPVRAAGTPPSRPGSGRPARSG